MPKDAPYQLSRAAMRERYGSRAITSGGQSARDFTPSGRRARLEQEGLSPDDSVAKMDAEWRAQFRPSMNLAQRDTGSGVQVFRGPEKAPESMFTGGLASPEDIGTLVNQGAMGTVKTPFGTVTLPPSQPPEVMADFLPATTSPLSGFALPQRRPFLGGVMQQANKWRQPI
jgi:hypothetical protein